MKVRGSAPLGAAPASPLPDAGGTAARTLESSSCLIFCRKPALDGAAQFVFPLLCSSPAHPAHPPPAAPSPLPRPSPAPSQPSLAFPIALPRSELLFAPGLRVKAPLMPLGADMNRVSLRLSRWAPRLNPRPVLHWGMTMNSGGTERRRKGCSVLPETALSPGPK